ncbi:MAG: hypothetical protein JXA18_16525 [Chitinispirillaceae bacterium]|nr:hypothetical protein [Chitinispirillaceae bacterium]
MKSLKIIITALAGALFLTSCSLNPFSSKTEDEDNVEVTPEGVGAITFQSISEAQTAGNLLSMENPAPSNLLERSTLPRFSADAQQGLGKKSTADGFTIDTVDGKVRVIVATTVLFGTRYDTIEMMMDATVFDGIDGNESIIGFHGSMVHTNGTIDYYAIEDRDGDDIINGASAPQKVAFTVHTVYTKNVVGHPAGESALLSLEVGAGDDNDFGDETDTAAQADNLIYSASWIKMRDDDTLAYAFYEDADGDGVIAATGEGTVDVRFFEKDNPLKPLMEYGRATLRIERDGEGKERTVRFTAEEKFITGRLNRVWVVDESGDSTVGIGEIALVHFATNSPAVVDSEITARAVFTIDPGEDFGDVSDNLLMEMLLAKSFRFGRLDSMDFHCTFDPSVPHGQKATAGSFELTAQYRNGQTATLVGSFSAGVIEATYTGPQGNVTEVMLKEGESDS